MEFINNRYRILKKIEQNSHGTIYEALDISMNERVNLNILNSEYLPNTFFDESKEKYFKCENSKMLKIYDIAPIKIIDNRKLGNIHFYLYTNEIVKNRLQLFELYYELSEEQMIDFFVEVCQAVNYLHLKGKIYENINPDNVIVYKDNDNKIKVKLLDLFSSELKGYRNVYTDKKYINYKAPEIIDGNKTFFSSDIYSIGMLFKNIFFDYNVINKENKYKINLDINRNIIGKKALFLKILRNMINKNVDKRYSSIKDIIKGINYVYKKEYTSYKMEDVKKLNFNIGFVGREKEFNRIKNQYYMLNTGKIGVSLISGPSGIGKTRFLKEIDKYLTYKGENVYSTYIVKKNNNNILLDILKPMFNESSREIKKKYERDLENVILNKNMDETNLLNMPKSKRYRIYDLIWNFISDSIGKNKIVFIIDNVDYLSEGFIELLEIYFSRSSRNKRILFIMSYNYEKLINNKKIIEFVNRINNLQDVQETVLKGFDLNKVGLMIKNILNISYFPQGFINRIYSHTYGSPLFIEEVMRELFNQGILYVSKNDGIWYWDETDYSKIRLPENLKKVAIKQTQSLDDITNIFLKRISVFNDFIDKEHIYQMFKNNYRVDEILCDLEDKGILTRNKNEMGFRYGFSNGIFKNVIYNKLTEEERINNHKLASMVYEKEFIKGKNQYLNTFIYHLEKANEIDKIKKYCLAISEKMIGKHKNQEAIKYLEKCTMIIKENNIEEKYIEQKDIDIFVKLAELYKMSGYTVKALKIFDTAIFYSEKIGDKRAVVDINESIVYLLLLKKGELKETKKRLQYMKEISENINYKEGKLKVTAVKICINLFYKINIIEAENMCKEALIECKENYLLIEARLYNLMGVIHQRKKMPEQAIQYFNKSIKLYEKGNYYKETIKCLNNIAINYNEYYKDLFKTKEYFDKSLELCEIYGCIDEKPLILGNLSIIYFQSYDYYISEKYLKEDLDFAISIEDNFNKLFSYNWLITIGIRISNFKKIEYYYSKTLKLIEGTNEETPFKYEYLIVDNFRKFIYCEYDEVSKSLEEINLKDNNEIEEGLYNDFYLLNTMLEIVSNKEFSKERIDELLTERKIITAYSEDLDQMLEFVILLYSNGKEQLARYMFHKIEGETYCNIENNLVKCKFMYVKNLLLHNPNIQETKKILNEIIKEDTNSYVELKCNTLKLLGDYYFKQKHYIVSVNYYLSIIDILKKNKKYIPTKSFFKYLKKNNYIDVFRNILFLIEYYCSKGKNISVDDILNHQISMDEIDEIFQFKYLNKVIKSRRFIESCKEIHNHKELYNINSINDVISNLCTDPFENLKFISKHLENLALATRCLILGVKPGEEKNIYVIASSNEDYNIPENMAIFEKTKLTERHTLLNYKSKDDIQKGNIFSNNMKGVICVPIIEEEKGTNTNYIRNNRRKNIIKNRKIVGFLYFETDKILNKFNDETLKQIDEYDKLIAFTIKSYEFKMNSAIDKMTGVYTRKYIMDTLSEYLMKVNNEKEQLSILMIDLDHFKFINDKFGHQKGDYVLTETCSNIMENIRGTDIIGRYGGEEFIIILPNTNKDEALLVGEKIRKKIENSVILTREGDITISVGIASCPEHAYLKNDLIEKADKSLYVAKEEGRNQCRVYDPFLQSKNEGANKLSGIITGNSFQDSRNVLTMMEMLDIAEEDSCKEEKIQKFLKRIIESVEAEYGIFIEIEEDIIKKRFCKKRYKDEWCEELYYNDKFIEQIISKKKGICSIDWDEFFRVNSITGMPDWDSVIAVPIIDRHIVKGVIYLTVSTSEKEFNWSDYNFINILCKTAARIFI